MNIATADHVDRERLQTFLAERNRAVLQTYRADGRPQLSPVTCGLDSAGRLVVATYPERAKARNLRRDARAAACVLSEAFDGPWVQVEGIAEVLDLPEALEPLVGYFRAVVGEHPDWEEYREAMRRQRKSIVRLSINRWGPIATGGFPPRLAEGADD